MNSVGCEGYAGVQSVGAWDNRERDNATQVYCEKFFGAEIYSK